MRNPIAIIAMAAIIAVMGTTILFDGRGPTWQPPDGDIRAFAYTTADQLVVVRDNRVVASTTGVFLPGDEMIWTHNGEFVAVLSNAAIDKRDERELVYLDARSGVEKRLPCTGCTKIVALGDNAIVASVERGASDPVFLRFDLRENAIVSAVPVASGAKSALATGGPSKFLISRPDRNSTGAYLALARSSGDSYTVAGRYPTSTFRAVASPANDRGAEQFILARSGAGLGSARGCDLRTWVSIIEDGLIHPTNLSDAQPPGFSSHGYGELQMEDLWWGIDGSFHATFASSACTEDSSEVEVRKNDGRLQKVTRLKPIPYRKSSLWTLDMRSLKWVADKDAPQASMTRYIGRGSAIQLRIPDCTHPGLLSCKKGTLYEYAAGGERELATDVLSISSQPARPKYAEPCLVQRPSDRVAEIRHRTGPITCHRAQGIYTEYLRSDLPRGGNAQHIETNEWHCSAPTAGEEILNGTVGRCSNLKADPAWSFDVALPTCGINLHSPVIQAAIQIMPHEPISHIPWLTDPRSFRGNFDPCSPLSVVIITIEGATGSSPSHVLMFHNGIFVGTATPKAHAFTSLDTARTSADSVGLIYKTPGSCNACSDGTFTTVELHWDGNAVRMTGVPPE
ncbi:LppP/LprE family lipoprotein [Nocardia asiatica]|uniref:LppP/LprE family lipoprotein n=1 Tax=Nocardia asiatica TaxID=209252 RepID=UPI003EE203B1